MITIEQLLQEQDCAFPTEVWTLYQVADYTGISHYDYIINFDLEEACKPCNAHSMIKEELILMSVNDELVYVDRSVDQVGISKEIPDRWLLNLLQYETE